MLVEKVPVTDPRYRLGQRPPNAGRKFPPEVLTPGEIQALMAACSSRGPTGIRNRAIIVMLWRAGLRVAEACALEPKDVDPVAGTVTVLSGKGKRRRTVGLDPQAMAVVERWLDARRKLGVPRTYAPGAAVPLFCTVSRNNFAHPLRTAYVRSALKRAAVRAGIEKRVHPHGLRHTHAYELANEGVPVHIIQMQLGHASLSQTERYINHLAPVQVIRAMQARTWAEPPPAPTRAPTPAGADAELDELLAHDLADELAGAV